MTTFGAGSALTAAMLNNAFPTGLIKQSDENWNNTSGGGGTTIHGDAELNVPILANTNYQVTANVLVLDSSGGTAKIKMAWTQPASCILDLGTGVPHQNWNAAAGANLEVEWASWQNETAATTATKIFGSTSSASFTYPFRGTLRVGGTSGFLRLWWAQNTGSASNLTVRAGSSLILNPFTG